MELAYPRKPGSAVRVAEEDWIQGNPFGRCPACGSPAIEEIPIPGDEIITFYCSDVTCHDLKGKRTIWGCQKNPELLELEAQGGSWNKQQYPGEVFPMVCPD